MSLAERVRETVWPRRGLSGQLGYMALRPLSELFGIGVGLRNLGYRFRMLSVHRATVPVVSIGNLVVGGTGKTPFAVWLSGMLTARGFRVAVLSRGYGGTASGVTVVSHGAGPEAEVTLVGDEAVMIAKCVSGPVVTAARRIEGAAAAVQLGCDVVVLDDGFQHRALARTFDVVLFDGCREPLLPAGPSRERPSALKRADAIVIVDHDEPRAPYPLDRIAAGKSVYHMQIEPVALVETEGRRWREIPLPLLAAKRVVAVVGIARPEGFYTLLQRWEADIIDAFEFPDHHEYTTLNWQQISRRSRDADLVVTTEKDLVKLEAFPFATRKLVALRIAPRVDRPEELMDVLLAKTGLIASREGGLHGD